MRQEHPLVPETKEVLEEGQGQGKKDRDKVSEGRDSPMGFHRPGLGSSEQRK